jgi:hypothetical protein
MSLSEATQHSLSKYVAVRMIGFIADVRILRLSYKKVIELEWD